MAAMAEPTSCSCPVISSGVVTAEALHVLQTAVPSDMREPGVPHQRHPGDVTLWARHQLVPMLLVT
jgi:hypothetical protein